MTKSSSKTGGNVLETHLNWIYYFLFALIEKLELKIYNTNHQPPMRMSSQQHTCEYTYTIIAKDGNGRGHVSSFDRKLKIKILSFQFKILYRKKS